MAVINANIGTRATLTLGTSSYEWNSGTGIGFEITSIRFTGIERAAIDASHMGLADPIAAVVGNRKYIPGELISPGQLIIEGNFPSNVVPPFFGTPGTGSSAVELITITIPNGTTPGSWSGSGFLVSFEASIPMEEMMTCTLTFQFTGGISTALYAEGATPLTVATGS